VPRWMQETVISQNFIWRYGFLTREELNTIY
jgi:hypothetical protein